MEYSIKKSNGRNIIHQFSRGSCTIGKENLESVDFSFSELHSSNQSRRSFIFTIRYNNYFENKFKLSQFSVGSEEELRLIYNTIGEVLNNPPKFNYNVGDKFEIKNVEIQKIDGKCIKTTTYENVIGTISDKFNCDNVNNYILTFDSNQIFITDEYLNKLRRV